MLRYIDCGADDPEATRGKDAVLSELFGESTIITDDHKLTVRSEGGKPHQLFDLRNDPMELENLAADGRHAETVSSLVSTYLTPMRSRLDREKLEKYREYVRRTGRAN